MATAQIADGRLLVMANHDGGFDFTGDKSLINISTSGKVTLAYKDDLRFSPKVTLVNESGGGFEYTERDGEMILHEVRYCDGWRIDFSSWWHAHIWWVYTRWARVKKRWKK